VREGDGSDREVHFGERKASLPLRLHAVSVRLELYHQANITTHTAAEVVAILAARSTSTATIVGFGSLLSETSCLGTCPGVTRFALGRVGAGWRRAFGHPAALFFERGIVPGCAGGAPSGGAAVPCGSLCAYAEDGARGFVVSTFDVPLEQLGALLQREEEFNFAEVAVTPLPAPGDEAGAAAAQISGWMCTRSSDEEVLGNRGHRAKYARWGLESVWQGWGWGEGSAWPGRQILPCPVYARHCVLAAQREVCTAPPPSPLPAPAPLPVLPSPCCDYSAADPRAAPTAGPGRAARGRGVVPGRDVPRGPRHDAAAVAGE